MADYTLTADTDLASLPSLSTGKSINLNGHVLYASADFSQYKLSFAESTSGTIRVLNGGCIDISDASSNLSKNLILEGGTSENPLPAHRDAGDGETQYPLRSAGCIYMRNGMTYSVKVKSHCAGNDNRPQFAKISGATANTLVFQTDMELEANDEIGVLIPLTQNADPLYSVFHVTAYDSSTFTATIAETLSPVPQSGSVCVLLTSGFCLAVSGAETAPAFNFSVDASISGDEVGLRYNQYAQNPVGNCAIDVGRLTVGVWRYPNDSNFLLFGSAKIGTLCANCANACMASQNYVAYPFSADIGRAFCASLVLGYYNWGGNSAGTGNYSQYRGNTGRGIKVRGGYHSIYPWEPLGAMECVDCEAPATMHGQLRETAELVVRTTNPETCTIHRAGGIATLVKKGGGDIIMAQAPVASAYQLAPTTTADAVWHDQAVTVEAGARLTVAWRAFCSIGAIGGVQILADSPLFGQVAVPMGAAEVLAEYTESSPPLGVWGPSRLLSWRNTSGQPVRVWVRGWGKGGIVYSSCQIVKGGQL